MSPQKHPYYHAVAFISDIHSNLEALEVVLDDIQRQNVSTIYCLGDIIGYGPDPLACIRKIMALYESKKILGIVAGNHDIGIVEIVMTATILWPGFQASGPTKSYKAQRNLLFCSKCARKN